MNEDELKDLWKNADAKETPIINFEQVRENVDGWHNKLRRKIKLELILGSLLTLVIVPFFYYNPELLYYLPFMVISSVWYYWEIWKMYKAKTAQDDAKSIKEFLENRTLNIKKYIYRTRLFLYTASPLISFSLFLINNTFEEIKESWLEILMLIIVTEICVIAFFEIYFRMIYFQAIKNSKELLKQLESEE